MWCVYVLKSLLDGRRYIGSTNCFERRLLQHQSGKVRSTKSRRPFLLIHQELYDNEHGARLRERFFKTHKGFNELNKIINKDKIGM